MWKKLSVVIVVALVLSALGWFLVTNNLQQVEVPEPPAPNPGQMETELSLQDPESLWVIVNKHNALPENYVPKNLGAPNVKLRLNANEEQMMLAKPARKDTQAMFNAAKKDGVALVFGSGYRSGELQREFYTQYVAQDGKKAADHYSARPGYSEHQTGLALDLVSESSECYLEVCWAKTPEGKWVAANAHKYGFVIRYPNKKQDITGYQYEPWHLRYVGRDLAQKVYDADQTLEEYFGLEAAPDYN